MDNYESAKLDHDGAQRPFHNAVQYRIPWGRNALAGAMPVLVIGCAMPRHDSAQGRRLFHNWLFWLVPLCHHINSACILGVRTTLVRCVSLVGVPDRASYEPRSHLGV